MADEKVKAAPGLDTVGKTEPFTAESAEPAQVGETGVVEPEHEETVALGTRYIRYTGTSNTREISEDDWRRAGVVHKDRRTITWGPHNGKIVEADQLDFLSEEEFDRLIKGDGDFEILVSAE